MDRLRGNTLVEHLALSPVDMSIAAVLLFPNKSGEELVSNQCLVGGIDVITSNSRSRDGWREDDFPSFGSTNQPNQGRR